MYECYECGKEFETPEYLPPEHHMGPDYEVCPECGSDDIVEVDDYEDDEDFDIVDSWEDEV